MFLILQSSTLKSTLYRTTAGTQELALSKQSRLEGREAAADSRAEGLSAIEDGGQAAISLTPDGQEPMLTT